MYSQFRWTAPSLQRNTILRAFEPIQPYVLVSLAEKLECDTFIDVGANIGAYSLFLSSLPTIRNVHAFEPSPDSFHELTQNIRLNGLGGKIIAHPQAVSASAGKLAFGMTRSLSGTNSIVVTSIHERSLFERQIEVEAVRLDDVLTIRGQTICLKIDVEGHERDALLGMRELLARNKAVVQIERYEGGREYLDLLHDLGFVQLFQLGPDRYLSNIDAADAELLRVFERSAALMIDAAVGSTASAAPVEVKLGNSLTLHLDGGLAKTARRGRSVMRRLVNR